MNSTENDNQKPALSAATGSGSFVIDHNVPVPLGWTKRRLKYPFDKMKPGDSFFCPSPIGKTAKNRAVTSAAAYWARRNPGMRFTTRQAIEGGTMGIRVWCLNGPNK